MTSDFENVPFPNKIAKLETTVLQASLHISSIIRTLITSLLIDGSGVQILLSVRLAGYKYIMFNLK